MPLLHLLAGPNGAGKTSCARDVLSPATHLPFINAYEIAAERWPDAQAEHAYEGARVAEAERREKIATEKSFISETVFSHPSKVQLVADVAEVFDNSSAPNPFRLCATYRNGALVGDPDWPEWVPDALLS